MKTVLQLATEFREAMEQAQEDGVFRNDIFLKFFPRRSCGEASTLLAEYLMENGHSTCYICGTYYGDDEDYMQSHAWLLTDDEKLIVDITGDQFRGNPHFLYFDEPVFVGKHHELYDLFEYNAQRDVGQHRRGNILTTAERKHYYDAIVEYIR